jgi:hypothetical protein
VLRNRLADAILGALGDEEARRRLAELSAGGIALERWLGREAAGHARCVRERARRASEALAGLPTTPAPAPLATALAAAARLFDAGLHFEVHEALEPHWRAAAGGEREALQGLIQIAVGYQHCANGNRAGARALLEDGAARIAACRLRGVALGPFAGAVRASLPRVAAGDDPEVPPFPRGFRDD